MCVCSGGEPAERGTKQLHRRQNNTKFLNGWDLHFMETQSSSQKDVFKGTVRPKLQFCYYSPSLQLFQTCLSFSILLNTKHIFLRMLLNNELAVAIDFNRLGKNTMGVNGYRQLSG